MTEPVAMIPYTNMAPYRELGPPAGCRFVALTPRASIAALCRRQVIAAAVPVGGLASVAAETEFLGPFGIAAAERSMSVLFFSARPLTEMGMDTVVRLTPESASSVRLLYLVLGYRNGFQNLPQPAPSGMHPDGELLIGDAALTRMREHRKCSPSEPFAGGFVTDLASEWFAIHQLPFVFARWVVRKDAPSRARRALEAWLDEFKAREGELVRRAVSKAARRLKLSDAEIAAYFQVIRRTLDASDMAGQERFQSEYQKHFAADEKSCGPLADPWEQPSDGARRAAV